MEVETHMYEVVGLTIDEVREQEHQRISNEIGRANDASMAAAAKRGQQGLRQFTQERLLLYASSVGSRLSEELSNRLGHYYMYLFLNMTAQRLAEAYGVRRRILGEISESELPRGLPVRLSLVHLRPEP